MRTSIYIKYTKKIILNIFGDDINQIKSKFKLTKYKCIYYEGNPDYIDLWCMSLCNFNIISHSTLSWWGAYLNTDPDKIVVYPSKWINTHHDLNDLFPNDWLKV